MFFARADPSLASAIVSAPILGAATVLPIEHASAVGLPSTLSPPVLELARRRIVVHKIYKVRDLGHSRGNFITCLSMLIYCTFLVTNLLAEKLCASIGGISNSSNANTTAPTSAPAPSVFTGNAQVAIGKAGYLMGSCLVVILGYLACVL